jgi:hypothetical protein
MSVSIYYEAKRAKPLSESEKQMVDEIESLQAAET